MPLSAQFIGVKSVPVASGNQFLMLPSHNRGLGEISIAVADEMGDPYRNPAKGMHASRNRVFSSPAFYHITGENGSGRTLPLGVLLTRGEWFGGGAVAFQQLSLQKPEDLPFATFRASSFEDALKVDGFNSLRDQNRFNWYARGFLGKRWRDHFSVGIGGSWASLDAVDGVEFLYAQSTDLRQFGHQWDLRLGLQGTWPQDQTVEAVLLYRHFNMTHDVTYLRWVENVETGLFMPAEVTERNLDRTRTWGLHLGYRRSLGSNGWKGGGIFTVNRKSHPKIPNYELMNIPRDPGNTWALNVGVGFSRKSRAGDLVGFELIFEPIWSNTWAESATEMVTSNGGHIPVGGKTINNDFAFANWLLRFGIGHQMPEKSVGFQLGVQIHLIQYWLDQTNFVEDFRRSQWERWAEWTPSLGLIWKPDPLELRYTTMVTFGTGRPGVSSGLRLAFDQGGSAAASDVILAPAGPLALASELVITHQVTVTLSLGE